MSRQTGGHSGPHASRADKPCAPSMLKGTKGMQESRRVIKRNHNRKSRQWVRRILSGKVEP